MLPYHKYDVEHYKYTPSEARATSVPHCSGFSDLTKKISIESFLKTMIFHNTTCIISFVTVSN